MCIDLINMFLFNYPDRPCSVATFYTGQVMLLIIYSLLVCYVSNVAKRSISDQCNIEDRLTNDRFLFLEEPS